MMEKYVCTGCGFIYDPAEGDSLYFIKAGTPFEALREEWSCPICYAGKDAFDRL
jgi:rubredoxin